MFKLSKDDYFYLKNTKYMFSVQDLHIDKSQFSDDNAVKEFEFINPRGFIEESQLNLGDAVSQVFGPSIQSSNPESKDQTKDPFIHLKFYEDHNDPILKEG